MSLAKTLATIACAALLSAGMIGMTPNAYAQDAEETAPEAGAWSAGTQGAPESSSEPQVSPEVRGCWSGTMDDGSEGEGTAAFKFKRSGKAIVLPSTFDFVWDAQNFAHGPISGTVSPTGIKFKGSAGRNCLISGSGTINGDEIDGTYTFTKGCAQFFFGGTFAITQGCP